MPQALIHRVYHPFLKYFRSKRMAEFVRRFSPTESTRILDVGGTPFNWTLVNTRPEVIFVNHVVPEGLDPGCCVVGDARALPFKDASAEVVYSNSLIEHLGDKNEQQLFANEVRRVGKAYYVQTPNRWFPVETHMLTLFVHWLPAKGSAGKLTQFLWRRLSVRRLIAPASSLDFMKSVRLISAADMRRLFADAEIWKERLGGLCKSIIAVKQ